MSDLREKLALSACSGLLAAMLCAPALAQESVKIGVVLPLSGPNAQFGINSRTELTLLFKEYIEA